MKKSKFIFVALLLVFTLVLTACAKDPDSPSPSTSSGGDTTPQASDNQDLDWDNPIYIGFALDMSTENGSHFMFGIDTAIKELNDAGGFNGRPYEMVYEATGGQDQQVYINAVMKLLDRYDDLSAIIADINTPYVLATIGNIESAGGLPYITGASSRSNAETGSEWVFITRTVDIYSAANMAQYVMEEGAESIGILRMSDASGTSWTERFNEVLLEQFNVVPTVEEVFDERTETNFTPYVLKAISAGCDTIISKSGVVNEQVINAVFDNGFEGLKFDPDISTTHLRNCGEKIEGWRSTSDFNDKYAEKKPYLQWFNELFEAEFDLRSVRSAVQYHDIMMLIAQAIENAGTADDKAAIRDGFYQIKDFEGLMTDYTYHEVGRTFPDYQYKLAVDGGEFIIEDLLMTYEVNNIYTYAAGEEPANYSIDRDADRARQEG